MKYHGYPDFKHNQHGRVGVLLTNLGTPEAPTAKALRPYLKQFLWDPRVVEVPRPLWWLILNGIILRVRPKRSAAAYAEVWTDEGSPLLTHSLNQAKALQCALAEPYGDQVIVDVAMRYGQPSIGSVIDKMLSAGVRKLIVLPLYPQYSAATTGSTFDAIADEFKQRRWLPDFRFISHYHDHSGFIHAITNRIKAHWAEHGRTDKLLFSYHGMPQKYLENGDPYHCECHKTTRLIAEQLGLAPNEYLTTFQSRFGRDPWLQPYTDETLKALPQQGVKSVQIICPGFSSDCLETIEEIGGENCEYFLEAGGERYEYIPCLNAEPDHIELMRTLIEEQAKDWLTAQTQDAQQTQDLAIALGAKQ
ncbi:Ferrochelatase, protoheme ferro-lyase [Aequoribacter fuscus]|uniref:Ferrochelatase n=1 Tax=Aequoribacter fuscus TaxID=2518989 RepID=F3L433_9GAMM|nr:ferrochelatase [Aequoribacter fuscus]EGG28920.1 Ferrochelatase, protoheme ferro-lyase [Aequoribacter fuscus]QHJ87422.1 ferrochelatase [Aequoribacter fuscus]